MLPGPNNIPWVYRQDQHVLFSTRSLHPKRVLGKAVPSSGRSPQPLTIHRPWKTRAMPQFEIMYKKQHPLSVPMQCITIKGELTCMFMLDESCWLTVR